MGSFLPATRSGSCYAGYGWSVQGSLYGPPHAKRSAQKLLAEEFDVVVRSHGEPLYGGRTSGYRKRSPATTATYSKENSGECILKSTFERGTLYGEVILTREIDAF